MELKQKNVWKGITSHFWLEFTIIILTLLLVISHQAKSAIVNNMPLLPQQHINITTEITGKGGFHI